ncbi:hypothetical protein B4W72_03570 [Staphylococcus delphini]|uniref:Asparagine synthetase domain-containing protein n=1 Tax=Staphylococcus delphini TaxID=53344 RepID=A0A2A4GZ47_9STAP|nr:hypothetical protein [Staphylococcus delphini]PCF56127.1 hypothetical protein B5C08_04160 [Staphylococcus delphini]PCF62364.1 hypothetical protein B5C01_05090 [Staphylococcus delphini]PCF74623.1 hypothetical protein B4W72_03570 [Staphylococcus delphini]HEC2158350.1 hypothetical protein [Staphylococcus delphini]
MHNDLQFINFAKSFFILPNEQAFELDGYLHQKISHKMIYFTPDLNHITFSVRGYQIFILGELVDVRDSIKSVDMIVSDLLQHPIDSDAFLNEMSFFNGRYGLFIAIEDKLYFYNDATSFFSMYYHDVQPVYASHSKLLHQLLQQIYGIEERCIVDKMRGFLDLSKYENIYKFNANMRFELNAHTLKRIYPVVQHQTLDTTRIVEQAIPLMQEMVAYIYRMGRPVVMSLTGGFDSRVSLALLKDKLPQTLFFTYLKTDGQEITRAQKRIYDIDQKAVHFLVDQLHLKHHFFNINHNDGDQTVADLYTHYESSHSENMIHYYSQHAQFQNVSHVKSSVFELAKGIRPKEVEQQCDNIEAYVPYIEKWSPIKEKSWIQHAFAQFIARNEISACVEKGYHPYDVLYLESRMNGWHSAIIQESDPYMEVYNLIHCRFILFQLMQMDYDARKQHAFHKAVIERCWPLLHFFGFNTDKHLYHQYVNLKKELESYQNQSKKTQTTKLTYETQDFKQTFQEKSIHFKLNRQKFVEHEVYQLNILNAHNEAIPISIRTFYKNHKGRARIFITIDDEKYDIVDLGYKGVEKTMAPQSQLSISLQSTKDIDKLSWLEAAKFQVQEINSK